VDVEEEEPVEDIPGRIEELTKEMRAAAKKLEYEKAAELRDRIRALSTKMGTDSNL
jgi:excinuclease ABC subunit B